MANHGEGTTVSPQLDMLNWPTIGLTIAVWPWLNELWALVPGPTAVYMGVSAAFMLFQMSDKLGLLERFKRRSPPEQPKGT